PGGTFTLCSIASLPGVLRVRLPHLVLPLRPLHATASLSSPGEVAVGIAVTGYPPHRSGRALLTHPAPTSGVWRKSAAKDKDVQ
ncbi:hypothetical protein, partial [Photorhabdus hainanensis]|uniref:hypothetical protein n=1 Tax=Photorhabdus hainanensis TaxID=1004166 RepID=UPI001BD4FADC